MLLRKEQLEAHLNDFEGNSPLHAGVVRNEIALNLFNTAQHGLTQGAVFAEPPDYLFVSITDLSDLAVYLVAINQPESIEQARVALHRIWHAIENDSYQWLDQPINAWHLGNQFSSEWRNFGKWPVADDRHANNELWAKLLENGLIIYDERPRQT